MIPSHIIPMLNIPFFLAICIYVCHLIKKFITLFASSKEKKLLPPISNISHIRVFEGDQKYKFICTF